MGIDEYDAELHEKTLIDIGYERGHSDGIDTGRKQGIDIGCNIGLERTAINMLKAGKLSVEEISMYSGLTIEQVLKLKDEL